MSSFSIGTSPQAIAQGYQSAVTIYNEGPDTVWVDDNTSVSSVTGFAILPGDSMVWQADNELYAVARALPRTTPGPAGTYQNYSGSAVVKVTPTGQAFTPSQLSSRAVVTHFGSFDAGEYQGDMLNVSSYDHVDMKIVQTSMIVPPTGWELRLYWYDENALFIREEKRLGTANSRTTVRLVTEGSYLAWRFITDDFPTTPADPTEPTFMVIGHTRPDSASTISLQEPYYYNSSDDSTRAASTTHTGGKVVLFSLNFHAGRKVPDTSVNFYVPDLGSIARVRFELSAVPTTTTVWRLTANTGATSDEPVSSILGSNTSTITEGDLYMPVGQQGVITIEGTKPMNGVADLAIVQLSVVYRD